uniref:Sushi domain containing 1 n=1 Tax=Sphaeramia orbicularis TaxID=375764 RepID=A0A673AIM3_9TELE
MFDTSAVETIDLWVFSLVSDMPVAGHSLDVCASCHANATCEDKLDGSGKVCNCKYGFVGNGRTFCQDKDECQIGATKICGHHTTCHNTFGSYYCTCLDGYSPSNNMAIFIPNDGTHCQDIDECRITGLCGEGAECRNLEGSYDCSCKLGYRVHNGHEPFQPDRDEATCEEVDCGPPPALPHSRMLWNKSSRMGAEVVYQCNSGYRNVGEGSVSTCSAAGQWEGPSVLCKEIICGDPLTLPHTGKVWNGSSKPGSTVTYYCKTGFYYSEGNNVSLCTIYGHWTEANISCAIFHVQSVSAITSNAEFSHVFCCKIQKYVTVQNFIGSRDYQTSFHDKRKRFLSSKAEELKLCLNLLPFTNYSISITATLARFTASITTNTSLPGIKVQPILLYQVFVLPVEGIMVFDCSSPGHPNPETKSRSSTDYIAAQIQVRRVGTEMNFTVGDGLYYEGFFNTPLQNGRNYYIILRAVSQWKTYVGMYRWCVLDLN